MAIVEEKFKRRLEELKAEQKFLLSQLDKTRSNRMFLCACGKHHRIKNCSVIQTHWYTHPHGCMGGDYWNEGELNIVCSDNEEIRNRILFHDNLAEYENRQKYDYNLEMQFKRMYKHLFKGVIDEHEHGNNGIFTYFFEKNAKRFGLSRKKD